MKFSKKRNLIMPKNPPKSKTNYRKKQQEENVRENITKMEGLSSEVSEKIRAAIRAKLKELGAYVDDELPDYIMVLVANKKTQEQMKDDLQLFLHQHAEVFTSWLQDILNKLKQVTKKSVETSKPVKKEKEIKTKKKEKEKKEKKKKKSKKESSPERKRPRSRSRSRSPLHKRIRSEKPRSQVSVVSRRPHPPPSRPRERQSSLRSSFDYDPEQMLKSQIQVARKTSSTPAQKSLILKAVAEADKSVTRKRAETRRQKNSDLEEIHQRRMKATLAARRFKTGGETKSGRATKSNVTRSPNKPKRSRHQRTPSSSSSSSAAASANSAPNSSMSEAEEPKDDLRLRLEERKKRKKGDEDEDAELELIRQRALNSMIQNKQLKRGVSEEAKEAEEKKILIPLNEDTSDDEEDEALSLSSNGDDKAAAARKTQPLSDPKFIVTLDGINSSYFKDKNDVQYKNKPAAIIAPMKHHVPAEEEKAKEAPKSKIEVAAKKKVRARITAPEADPPKSIPVVTTKEVCRFWPRCKRGDTCEYLHPKSPRPVLSVHQPLPASSRRDALNKFKWTR